MRLVFAGTPEFARSALAALFDAGHEVALVLAQPDRPAGRGLRLSESPVKRLALERGVEVFQPRTLRDTSAVSRVSAARPEALVVAAYGLILPQAVLDVAPLGALNIHASLLPRWRGAAPIARALMAGDRETGVTIMKMDAGLDTGPMLAQRRIEIVPQDDGATLHDKLASLGAEMMVDALAAIRAGPVEYRPQPREGVTYAHKIEKREAWLDWTRSAIELERAVRAFRPAPGAQTTLRGETLKIWRASLADGQGEPGLVVRADPEGLLVACGAGTLALTELQRAGGRRLSAAELLRGWKIAAGDRFGAAAQ